MTTNPMDVVNQILSASAAGGIAVSTGSPRWLVCDRCNQIHEHDMSTLPPAVCPKCNEQTTFKVMPSAEKAEALRQSRLRPATPTPAPVVPEAAPVTPPVPVVPPAQVTQPTPEPPAPKAPRTPRTRRKVEAATAPEPAPAQASVDPSASMDYKAIREAAAAALIRKYALNEIEIKPVGTGTVFTLGFTRWTENGEGTRVPVYSFMELTDTPQSFKEELNSARSSDGTVTVDVARVTGLVPEVSAACFGGELIASLKNSTGPVRVMAGARVKLGARLSQKGRLVWFVMGVEK